MAAVTQIQVGTKGYLDVTEDVIVPLNFSVASVQDITKRQGTFSKTIKLPNTPSNASILGYLFDVNVEDSVFNPKHKEKVLITKNGVVQFEGIMQLLSVTKSSPSLPNQDELISWDVAVKEDSGDFFTNLGDEWIETLQKFTGITSGYTFKNVMVTSGYTWQNYYKFYLPYHLREAYTLIDFTPAISAKRIWDAIWLEAGYEYQWPTMSATSFDRMWIPYNGEAPRLRKSEINALSFKASYLTATTVDYNFQLLPPLSIAPQSPPAPNLIYIGFWESGAALLVTPSPQILVWDDDSTSGATGNLFDPASQYNTATGKFTSTVQNTYNFEVNFEWELYLFNPTAAAMYLDTGAGSSQLPGQSSFNIVIDSTITGVPAGLGTQQIPINSQNVLTYDSVGSVALQPGNNYITSGVCHIGGIPSVGWFPGSTVWVNYSITWQPTSTDPAYLNLSNNDPAWYYAWADVTQTPIAFVDYPTMTFKIKTAPASYQTTYFKGAPLGPLSEGNTVHLSDFLPKKIKRKDFILSVIKLFNLYITPTDFDKVLRCETRDEFYDNGGTQDWSLKLVTEDDTTLKYLPDLQNKKMLFSYKEDKDDFNKKYTEATGEIYGQLEYTFDSDFTNGTKSIQPIFSPTPLEENFFGLVVPTIDAVAPKNNIRILLDGGNITNLAQSKWYYSAATGVTIVNGKPQPLIMDYESSVYTYMGHFDNPYIANLDISFGSNDFLFYDNYEHITDNNLYNQYYRRYLSQIENGKLFTANFRLTELDIANLNFRDRIQVHDKYYYINKIIDYDCNKVDGKTKVELINVEPGLRFIPTKHYSIAFNHTLFLGEDQSNFRYTSIYGPGSRNITNNGEFNIFQPGSSNIIANGDNNSVAGDSHTVQGSNNNVLGSANSVIGNGNSTT